MATVSEASVFMVSSLTFKLYWARRAVPMPIEIPIINHFHDVYFSSFNRVSSDVVASPEPLRYIFSFIFIGVSLNPRSVNSSPAAMVRHFVPPSKLTSKLFAP